MKEYRNDIKRALSFIENDYFRERLLSYLVDLFELPLRIKGILLFGSVARGDAVINEEHMSDIDLIVISEDFPEDKWARKEKMFEFTRNFAGGVQALWWTPEELVKKVENKFYLLLDALDEGKILHDPEGLLHEQRRKLRADLGKKGVIKRELYWRWPIKEFGDEIEF